MSILELTGAESCKECGEKAQAERDRLLAENAALRELVRDMYEMAYPEYPSAFDATFADLMHELGLEASE